MSSGAVYVIDICSLPISGTNTIPILNTLFTENTRSIIAITKGTILNLKQKRAAFSYTLTAASNQRCFFVLAFLRTVAPMLGTTVSATTRLAHRLYAIVRHISCIICLVIPSVNTIGRNTHIVVSVEEKIAPATWFAPITAARAAPMPLLLNL